MTPSPDWVLCFVRGDWAWFTTHDLSDLSGDDWNDESYQDSGSLPNSPTRAYDDPDAYMKVAFDGPLQEPADVHGISNQITVNDLVHRRSVPWLQTSGDAAKYSDDIDHVNIFAGTPIDRFEELIGQVGGDVYHARRGKCAFCGSVTPADGDRGGVRAGKLLCADCSRQTVEYTTECLDCDWTYQRAGSAFNWYHTRSRVQQEGNNHESKMSTFEDETHETVWRELDGDGGGD